MSAAGRNRDTTMARSAGTTGRGDPRLAREGTFAFWTSEKIRFQDVDRLDHVNNVTFAVYAESGRVEFLAKVTPPAVLGDGPDWVIAELTLRYLEQTHYPGEIRIGTMVLRLGRSSVTLGQGLFEGDRCVATSEAVVVLVDPDSGRSVALPAAARAALEGYAIAG